MGLLVGRRRHLDRLADVLDATDPDRLALVGPAGVGKSRLLEELCARAATAGWFVARVFASPTASAVPFAAVSHLLPDDTGADDLGGLLRRVRRSLLRQAATSRVLLAVDDAHALDPGSSAFVHHVVTTTRIPVVITMRSEEPTPETLTGLWKDGHLERIDVGALDRSETGELVRAVLDGAVADEVQRAVWDLTLGHPLFVRLLLDDARAAGVVIERRGTWRWEGQPTDLPALSAIVEGQLADLPPDERAVIELTALVEPVRLRRMVAVAPEPTLRRLEARALISIEPQPSDDDVVRLGHPLYGDVLRLSAPGAQAREAVARLAVEVLEDADRRSGDLMRAASWLMAAGQRPSPELATGGAREALVRLDLGLAKRLARIAVEGGGAFEAWLSLGQALRHDGRGSEADTAFAQAQRAATSDDERATAAIGRANSRAIVLGDYDGALRGLREALGSLSAPAPTRRVVLEHTFLAGVVGDFDHLVATAPAILDDPDADGVTILSVAVGCLFGQAITLALDGVDEVHRRGRVLADALRSEMPLAVDQLDVSSVFARVGQARCEEAEAQARDGLRRAHDTGGPVGTWCVAVAFARGFTGDLHGAFCVARDAVLEMERFDPLGNLLLARELTALSALQAGYPDEADAFCSTAEEAVGDFDRRAHELISGRVEAWRAVLAGDIVGAARRSADAGRRALDTGNRLWALTALHDVVRWGRSDLVRDELGELVATSDSPLARLVTDHAEALAARDAAGLEAAAARYVAGGCLLAASEAEAQAAALHRTAGHDVAAERAATRAELRWDTCTGTRPSALPPAPAGLTGRERSVALLAVAGETSRRIADELVLSVRTVDNHLGRVYRKLGVSGRDELHAVLCPPLPVIE